MKRERVSFENTVETMKKIGILNADGTVNKPPAKMAMEERRDKAKDDEIQRLVNSLDTIEAKCTRDEFIQFLRIGMAFTSWGTLRLVQGVETAQNLLLTPFKASAAIMIPGLDSAVENHSLLSEAILEKLRRMGVDPSIPWRPSGEA